MAGVSRTTGVCLASPRQSEAQHPSGESRLTSSPRPSSPCLQTLALSYSGSELQQCASCLSGSVLCMNDAEGLPCCPALTENEMERQTNLICKGVHTLRVFGMAGEAEQLGGRFSFFIFVWLIMDNLSLPLT